MNRLVAEAMARPCDRAGAVGSFEYFREDEKHESRVAVTLNR